MVQLSDCALAEPYSSFIESRKTVSTRTDYRYRLNRFAHWLVLQGLSPFTITPKQLSAYLATLRDENCPVSIAHHAHVLHSFFKYLIATEQIYRDPSCIFSELGLHRRPPAPRPVDGGIRERMVLSLRYTTVHEIRCSLVVLMGLWEGLRIGETAALEWDKIHFNTDEFSVMGKGQKIRTMPMHPTVRAALWKLREMQADLFSKTPNRYVFQTTGAFSHPSRGTMTRWFIEACSWTPNLPHFTPHALRHTFGTMLADAGRSVYEIRDLMGHASIYMSEIYVQNTAQKSTLAYKQAFGLSLNAPAKQANS